MKDVGGLTFREMIQKRLFHSKIPCFNLKTCLKPKSHHKQLYITNLPDYDDICYTEDDLVQLLTPFGFKDAEDNIYILPQTRMAFAFMPNVNDARDVLKASKTKWIYLKGSRLHFQILENTFKVAPLYLYTSLMKLIQYPVIDDGSRTIYIKNISCSETYELKQSLKKIRSVRNFFPLLNKVFVEFDSVCNADRLGVWYSLLKHAPAHKIYRLMIPDVCPTGVQPPEFPNNAVPPSKDAVTGATIPSIKFGIPLDTIGPFWVTLKSHPFLYPTTSPWFIIPNHLTVHTQEDIEKASRGAMFPTIMLTGLPAGYYKHEDVSKLVWGYFPNQNLHSLYYNVVVLPLQRRAFVFFPDWSSCCNFVRDHVSHQVSVNQTSLTVHFVLEQIYPASSEEMMYSTLMKWSNAGVPESKCLEERLLCVETSETSLNVIRVVMDVVASIAPFVSFLPLANRICIEMEDSSVVTKVVEKCKTLLADCFKNPEAWSKVKHVEPLKSLKQRLQDTTDIKNFEANPIKVKTPPLSELTGIESEPAKQTTDSGSFIFEPITPEPSDVAPSDLSGQEDFTDDIALSDACCFDELNSVDDEVTVCPPEYEEVEIGGSLQVSDSVPEGKAATGQEDSHLVQDDSSTVNQLSEDHETSNVETSQVSDKGSTQTPRDMEDGKNRKEQIVKGKMLSAESCNAIKDVDNLDSQSPNEDQPLPDSDNKDSLKDPDSDVTEQETFEILDSIDDLDSAEDNSQKLEIPSDDISKEDIEPVEEEEDTYQVIDSVEDPPMTTESDASNIGKRKVGRGTGRKDGKRLKRIGSTTRASKGEGKEKPEWAVKKYMTQTKKDLTARDSKNDEEVTEDVVYKIVDSVEDEPVQDAPTVETSVRRRSARGKKDHIDQSLNLTEASKKPEEATYEILDSVDGENANEEPTPRPTRGRRGRPPKKVVTSPRWRQTPGRESQERNKERTPKLEERVPPKESIPSKQSEVGEGDATDEVEVVQEDRPAPRKRGRPRKDAKTTKKNAHVPEQQMTTEDETKGTTSSTEESSAGKEDTPTCGGMVLEEAEKVGVEEVGVEEEPLYQIVDDLESSDEPSAAEGSLTPETSRADMQTLQSQSDTDVVEVEDKQKSPQQSTLEPHPPSQEEESVDFFNPETLDEAGDDEEEKPDEEQAKKNDHKRKNDDDAVLEEGMNFVTEEEEEEEEAVKTRTKGRAKKRTRQTPVRKSTRGKKVAAEDEREEEEREPAGTDVLPPTALDASSSPGKDPSSLSSVGRPEIRKAEVEVEAAGQADSDAAPAGLELQTEHAEDQTLEGCVEEGLSRADIKVGSKPRRETGGPAAKRSRSQSPSVAADVKLPAFTPNNPLGQEFVLPKSGYFCSLCSMFYLSESAKYRHCGSRRHYDNLQKHFQKLQEKPSCSSQGSVSD